MRTSTMSGALCAVGFMLLTGCGTSSTLPAATRAPGLFSPATANEHARVPGVGFYLSFDADGSRVSPDNRAVLDEAALWLKAGSDRCLTVDARVAAEAGDGRRLADARVRAVIAYVTSQHVPRTRVQAGRVRLDPSEDAVVLREDYFCNGGMDHSSPTSETPADTIASGGPARSDTTASRGVHSVGNSGPSDEGGRSPGDAQVGTESGSSDGASSEPEADASVGQGAPTSPPTGGGSTDATEDGPSTGSGSGSGSGSGNQSQNSPRGNNKGGVSSSTPAADRTDAGRGNGSEDGDPGRSGGRNQGGDEVDEQG